MLGAELPEPTSAPLSQPLVVDQSQYTRPECYTRRKQIVLARMHRAFVTDLSRLEVACVPLSD
jgi:hypothetical protein